MEFAYKKIFIKDAVTGRLFPIYRPIIPVTLLFDKNTITTEGLIDTGTDCNLFHASYGKNLGIDIKSVKGHKIGGVTGSTLAYNHKLAIKVGRDIHEVIVGFVYNCTYPHNLLGYIGFLNIYKATFDWYNKKITIKHHFKRK